MKLHYAHVKAARPEAGTDRDTWLAYLNQVYETDVPQVWVLYTGMFENRLR
jgi:hypothetical protein